MLALAKVIDKTAMKYDVDVIVTPQYTDIKLLADNTERILVFAQHMDYLPIGRVLAGVPDYVPAEVVDGKVTVMPAAFGELSEGILNVSKVKTGKLTMCRLTYDDGMYYMHMVTGEGITPRKWEEAGWTQPAPQLPGLEILLDDVESFAQNVMCEHYIISYGDNTEVIKNLCDMLGIQIID